MVKTVVALLVLSGLTLYGAERYSALTEEEIAYVYHPETDKVYTVVFGPAPDRLLKKQLLLPFQQPTREIKLVEEVAPMQKYLREKAAADTLFRNDLTTVATESATVRMVLSAGLSADSVREFGYRWAFPDLAWVPRNDLQPLDLLPLELSVILPAPTATWFWDAVRPVDAAVVREQPSAAVAQLTSTSNHVEVLDGALMIRGEAAEYLAKLLFADLVPRNYLLAHSQN